MHFRQQFLSPQLSLFALEFGHLWKDKDDEIGHKGKERRVQSGLYVVVNAPRYFPYFW